MISRHDQINAVRGIVPMTLNQARAIVDAVLDVRPPAGGYGANDNRAHAGLGLPCDVEGGQRCTIDDPPAEPDYERTACRTCGAEVIWARNPATGKNAPIDAEPPTDGGQGMVRLFLRQGLVSFEVLTAYPAAKLDPTAKSRLRRSHFATCPQAGAWRKRGVA